MSRLFARLVTAAFAQTRPTTMVCVGLHSCDRWLSSSTSKIDGINWLMGFWFGLNVGNQDNAAVDKNADGEGRAARLSPAQPLRA
jgi:hypothetical protein